ncbi:MAG: trans-4-hydroxy-L-proline dehydratase [Holophaga sp.]|jgi:formate C-acetyltransferase
MSERTLRLRQESLAAVPSITGERAEIVTAFYQENYGKHSMPVLRALNFQAIVERKELWLGEGELIVGERGPAPKSVPTFPELTCHSVEDLGILDCRPLTSYKVDPAVIETYRKQVIPYWKDRSMRNLMFAELPKAWIDCYKAGCFTEFMEQRSPGHTVADGKLYRKGLLDFKAEIEAHIASLDFVHDPEALDKREALRGMALSCDAVIRWAQRYAELAEAKAAGCKDPARKAELLKIAGMCRWVPAHAPRDFQEALQYYWFCHLAVITELNGWDAFSPGHLDQHLWPFYQKGLADGSLTRDQAKELLECFFIKFNNHTAPAKQGVTAAESGTYTDFANINLAGLLRDGADGSNELTHLLLEVVDEFHLLQPSSNMQVSRKTPDAVLKHALRVIRNGYGFPSLFNADAVVEEQLRQGKTLEDAREGGTSGCVEVGAFGKEAYILTGYFNLMKMLELAFHDGFDRRTGKQIGAHTGDPAGFRTFDDLFRAFETQFRHVLEIKMQGNLIIERMFATRMPHTFLSVITDDCIKKGKDYNAGGARYNNTFIQAVGIGSISDSLSALKEVVYEKEELGLPRFIQVLEDDFKGMETLRQRLVNKTHKYGNDDDYADDQMVRTFRMLFEAIDGRPNTKGGAFRVEMLPTTCHVYFGEVCLASPDGRRQGLPLSEGISPVQGADRKGPTAVLKSAGKMDHVKTGGTLLNMKFSPGLLEGEQGIDNLHSLVRSYFKLDGHHMQFNVVGAAKLREAQAKPEEYRDLIVRVAGYSDYFCDLSRSLQDEIIKRTEHAQF